jgi:hypothetical protein
MEIIQRKSKDSELADPVYCRLEGINIDGWIDEDGAPVSSAVVRQAEASEKKEKVKAPSQLQKHKKMIERAFWHGGAEEREGSPYISRSAFMDLLVKDGISEATAKNYAKVSYQNGPIFNLINADFITAFEHGWIVIDSAESSALMLAKGGI